jgi:hypothetical protein
MTMKKPRRASPELQLHLAVVRLLEITYADTRCDWTHFPAGEVRNAKTGAKLKRMGLKAGWGDFIFVLPGGIHAELEIKVEQGRVTPSQVAHGRHICALGAKYEVAYSVLGAMQILKSWGVIPADIL